MDDQQDLTGAGSAAPLPPPPPVLPLDVTDPPDVPTGRRRAGVIVGALAVGVLAAGGLVLVASRSGGPDADRALAAAQAVVEGAASYRFEARITQEVSTGDPDGAGTDSTTRTIVTGEVAAPDHWRSEVDMGDEWFAEEGPMVAIRLGDVGYVHGGFLDESQSGPPWTEVPGDLFEVTRSDIAEMYEMYDDEDLDLPDAVNDPARLELLIASYLLDVMQGSPESVTRVVTDLADPAVETPLDGGGVRLRATLPPVPELVEVAKDPLPPVDVLLDLDAEDRPSVVRFTAELDGASADVEVRFSDWGDVVDVAAPDPTEVDRTPWIAEEALAETPELLVLPSAVPDGMELTSAYVYEFEDGCPSVELWFGTEDEVAYEDDLSDEELDELWAEIDDVSLSISPRSCAEEYDDTPFDSTLGGLPSRGEDGYFEVLFGDAWVQIGTSFDVAAVESLVASLRPVTVDELAAAIPAWAADASML